MSREGGRCFQPQKKVRDEVDQESKGAPKDPAGLFLPTTWASKGGGKERKIREATDPDGGRKAGTRNKKKNSGAQPKARRRRTEALAE